MRVFWLILFLVLGAFRPAMAEDCERNYYHDCVREKGDNVLPRVHLGIDIGGWYQYRDQFYSGLTVFDRNIFQITGDLVLDIEAAKFVNVELSAGYAQGLNGDPIISYFRLNGAVLFGDFNWFRIGPMLYTEFSVYNSSFPGFFNNSAFDDRLIPGVIARMHVVDGFHLGASFGRSFLQTNVTDFEGEGWVTTLNATFFFF